MYGIMWFIAPWISDFYNRPILIPVLRWSALTLILYGVNGTQNAVLFREMKFKLSFWISLSGTISQGAIGVSMAYMGYGLWALVFSALGSQAISTIVRWVLIGWKPSFLFSFDRVRQLFGFGSKMMASCFLDTFFNQVYGLLIGKWYTPADLAYFNRGDSMPNMVMTSVQGVIGSVAFPALSTLQDDKGRLKSVMRRMMLTSSLIIFPAMFGLAAVAKPLVVLLLTEKWLPAVPYLQLACVSYAFWPVHVANLQAIQACGRSDVYLNLEIIKKVLIILSIALTFNYGVLALALGRALLGPIFAVINAFPCNKLINYSPIDQIRDLAPVFLIGCLAATIAYLPLLIIENPYLLLSIQVLIGMTVFMGTAFIFKIESVTYLLKNMKQAIGS
jgi:O-antigen/teichoic acid export membrane protein